MTDKIKQYAKWLWKHKYLILWIVLFIMLAVNSGWKEYSWTDRVIWAAIFSSLLVGFLAVTIWYVKGYVGFLMEQSEYMKWLDEQTFESRYQRELQKRRVREIRKNRIKNKIKEIQGHF